jgi:YVTN family beta-propeller protein
MKLHPRNEARMNSENGLTGISKKFGWTLAWLPVVRTVATMALFLGGMSALTGSSSAQTATGAIAIPSQPLAVTVNPVLNKVYSMVDDPIHHGVSVIDGSTNTTTFISLPYSPQAIASGPELTYVAGYDTNGGDFLTAIDGVTNATNTVALGTGGHATAIAVNPVTNRIYLAAEKGTAGLMEIDGASLTVNAVLYRYPVRAVVVNPATNIIYASASYYSRVEVIDGVSRATQEVAASVLTGKPSGLAVDTVNNKIYVADDRSFYVGEIDGATNTSTSFYVGWGMGDIKVNSVTNKIYVAPAITVGSGSITIIDGNRKTISVVPKQFYTAHIAIDESAGKIYVTDQHGTAVTIIDAYTDSISGVVNVGNAPSSMAVNPVTHKVYVAAGLNNITVIDDVAYPTYDRPTGKMPMAVAVNLLTEEIFVANMGSNTLTVIEGIGQTTISTGKAPTAIATNPVTNKVYVLNSGDSTVTAVDGYSLTATTIPVGTGSGSLAVNLITDHIYVTNAGSNTVTVIQGKTNATTTAPVGANPGAVAVNLTTNKTYVANYLGNSVTEIDGATNSTQTIPVRPGPVALAVNESTNRIYVANFRDNSVTVIDGVSHNTVTIPVGLGPSALALNPISDKVYVADVNDGAFGNTVTIIDGATNTLTSFVRVGHSPYALAVDTARNKIFVANLNGASVTVIDGVTTATTTVPVGSAPVALAVDSLKNDAYVVNLGSNSVTVLQGATPALVPFITSMSINAPSSLVTSIPGTATLNAYSNIPPPSPPLQQMYYQSDTWQSTWNNDHSQPATLASSLGVHVLYAFATDGEEADASASQPTAFSTFVGHKMTGTIAATAYVNILPSTLTARSVSPENSVAGRRVFVTVNRSPSSPNPAPQLEAPGQRQAATTGSGY